MRNFFAGLSGGTGAFAAAAVVVVVIAAGIWVQSEREQTAAVTPAALVSTQAVEPQVQQTEPAKPSGQQTAAEPESADEGAAPKEGETKPAKMASPAFDEVRREADGITVIAGTAAPGADVEVLKDGAVVARATADSAGKFAALAMIPPDGQGHVLNLVQQLGGEKTSSEGEIILAPTKPVVAQSNPVEDADPAPSETAAALADDAVPDEAASSDTLIADAEEDAEESVTAPVFAETDGTITKPEVVAALDPADDTATQPAPVAVLKSTADGVELLNTPSPEAMTNVALDTISYSDAGEVELTGRAQSDTASVRVYLDNTSVANLTVDEQGRWRGELPDVDEGIYTLRVDEVAADGGVTSRVETPFKREATEVLAAASAAQDGPIKAITVQKGATLWAIARERYGNGELYVRVFEANSAAIRNPDLIYPGQIFDLPD